VTESKNFVWQVPGVSKRVSPFAIFRYVYKLSTKLYKAFVPNPGTDRLRTAALRPRGSAS